jgi:hypothetical protein
VNDKTLELESEVARLKARLRDAHETLDCLLVPRERDGSTFTVSGRIQIVREREALMRQALRAILEHHEPRPGTLTPPSVLHEREQRDRALKLVREALEYRL